MHKKFWSENQMGSDHLEDPGTDGRILKFISVVGCGVDLCGSG
jgi:hypothetical protein